MICRKREGFLDIRSVSGDVAHEVDLRGERTILGAALDEGGERLAICFGRGYQMDVGYAEAPLVLIHLKTGEWRVLHEPCGPGLIWLPGQERLAFSSGSAICVADLTTGQVDEVFEVLGATGMQVRPDGRALAFLQWHEEEGQRVGVIDLHTREGRMYPVTCWSYCWWDTRAILYTPGSSLEMLDIASGESRIFLKHLAPLAESGALAALGEGWVRAARRPDADPHYQHVTTSGERVYFGVAVVFPPRGKFIPSLLPFLARPDPDSVQGVVSMTRECADLRLHHGETLGGHGVVPINDGRTLAINVLRKWMGGWVDHWAFVGEGAEDIPEGYGPLSRASPAVRSNVFVGDFARPD